MTWRLARSLETLRAQINELSPKRSKASDGTIGNIEHASRSSDHNPHVRDGAVGIVTALDLTHDPAHGIDSEALAEMLRASKDSRIKYLISNKKIASSEPTNGKPAWAWRPYSGKNPHDHHVHISVKPEKASYDLTRPWALSLSATETAKPAELEAPILRKGSQGADVEKLQSLLNKHGATLTVDGSFGDKTKRAVAAFQRKHGLVADGVVGFYTMKALEG